MTAHSPHFRRTFLRLLPVFFLGLAGAGTASAAVLYSQPFDNTGAVQGSSRAVTAIPNWAAYANATAVTPSGNPPTTTYNSGAAGTGTGFGNIYSNTSVITGIVGTGLSIGSTSEIDEISFDVVRSLTAGNVRLLIQLDNAAWYASEPAIIPTVANSAAFGNTTFELYHQTIDFTTAAASWRDFTLTPGTSMALGAAARTEPLPSGTVTGIGFFINRSTGVAMRFDTLEVMSVPEPGTAALWILGAAGLTLARMRRRI